MTNDTRAHKLRISENNILMMQHKMAKFVGIQTMVILVHYSMTFAIVDLWSQNSPFIQIQLNIL